MYNFIKSFFGLDKREAVISSGGDADVEGSAIVAGGSKVEGDVIASNSTINIYAPQFALLKQHSNESHAKLVKDKAGWERVLNIMQRSSSIENKKQLHKIYQQTEDAGLRIQIALIFGPWFIPTEDTSTQLLEVTNEAITYAMTSNANPQLAGLLAYKAKYLACQFAQEHQTYNYLLMEPKLGSEMRNWITREMDYKDQLSQKCIKEAEDFANESEDYSARAAVYLEKAAIATHLATHLAIGDIDRRVKEKEKMREAHATVEQIYKKVADELENNGELEIANARHNYANNLRMLGKQESEEAKSIEEEVVKVAEKYGDHSLILKSKMLLKRLNGEPMPDYVNGEDEGFSV